MKYSNHLWAKLVALGLVGAFSAQMVLAATPKTVTYTGPGGMDRGYVEQIIKSENEIQFNVCESGPKSCQLLKSDSGKDSFTLKELEDLASTQMIRTGAKSGQDLVLGVVAFWATRKFVLRPVGHGLATGYHLLKATGKATKFVFSPLVLIGAPTGLYIYDKEKFNSVVHWLGDKAADISPSTYEIGSHLFNGNTSRAQKVVERRAQELVNSGQRKADEIGVPSIDQLSGSVTDVRKRTESMLEASRPWITRHVDPSANYQVMKTLDSAAESVIDASITEVSVPDFERFVRNLRNGVDGNYLIR